MFGLGGGRKEPTIKEMAAVILSEKSMINVLQPNFDRNIKRISKDGNDFTLSFDECETVNGYVLGHEDMIRIFMKYYGRTVIEVGNFSDGHGQYLVRFED